MIRDKELIMSDAQEVLTTAASEDVIDLTEAGDAARNELYLVIRVDTVVARAAGAATVTFDLETDEDDGFATDMVTLFSSGAIGKASLGESVEAVKVRIPVGCKQFLRVYYTVSAALDTGKFDAFLVADPQITT